MKPSQSLIARARRARKRERMIDAAVRNTMCWAYNMPTFVTGQKWLDEGVEPMIEDEIRAEFLRLERDGM